MTGGGTQPQLSGVSCPRPRPQRSVILTKVHDHVDEEVGAPSPALDRCLGGGDQHLLDFWFSNHQQEGVGVEAVIPQQPGECLGIAQINLRCQIAR